MKNGTVLRFHFFMDITVSADMKHLINAIAFYLAIFRGILTVRRNTVVVQTARLNLDAI